MPTYEDVLRLPEPLNEQRLILFDGHSLAYRSYYAIRELTTQSGQPVQAVYGFWRALLRTIRAYPSSYVAVAFDAAGPTFRHEAYPEYKATRKPMPDDLASQLPLIRTLLKALGVPVFCESGVEADDVLATIAVQAADSGLHCLIVTSDKDMTQLVSDRIIILRPAGKNSRDDYLLLDRSGVQEKFGVPPERIVDLLSLVGDASDNVPGVPSVGEKTAVKLLTEYGSLDDVLSRASDVRNTRVRNNLIEYASAAHRARQLIQLKLDVSLDNAVDRCHLRGLNPEHLAQFFAEVEFRSASSDLSLDAAAPANPPEAEAPKNASHPIGYRTILTADELDRLKRSLADAKRVCIDLETTSVHPMEAQIVGVAVSTEPYKAAYIPIGHNALGAPAQLPLAIVLDALRPALESETTPVIGQNIKYDLIILARHGIRVRNLSFDSMIASHIAHPEERRHNLDRIAQVELGHTMTSYEDVAGKNGSFAAVSVDDATAYACEDAEIVQRVYPILREQVAAVGGEELYDNVEMPLVPVLATMERNGILIDCAVLEQQGRSLRKALEQTEAELFELADTPFNPNSPKQVAQVLFERLGLPVIERTKTGPSTGARVLAELGRLHPLPAKLLEHRELRKLLTTYIDQLPKAVHPETGRIHTSFHQTATATGRLSSSDPNLQNIPTRTELGAQIRTAFVAPLNHVLVSADYSQIELRLLAHLSEDPALVDAFATGADLHRRTAAYVFDTPEERVTEQQRGTAKRINFGIIYGISAFGLARDLGVDRAEAQQFIDRFFTAYPRAKAHLQAMVEDATCRGYAETLLGRRRPLPNLGSKNIARRNFDRRNAVNTPIQGGAADLMKLAMLRVDRVIAERGYPCRMILQIHDELLFEVADSVVDRALPDIQHAMEDVLPLLVPLRVKLASGETWNDV